MYSTVNNEGMNSYLLHLPQSVTFADFHLVNCIYNNCNSNCGIYNINESQADKVTNNITRDDINEEEADYNSLNNLYHPLTPEICRSDSYRISQSAEDKNTTLHEHHFVVSPLPSSPHLLNKITDEKEMKLAKIQNDTLSNNSLDRTSIEDRRQVCRLEFAIHEKGNKRDSSEKENDNDDDDNNNNHFEKWMLKHCSIKHRGFAISYDECLKQIVMDKILQVVT
jgi:hypothetical protein